MPAVKVAGKNYRAVWMTGRQVRVINQPLLPHRFQVISLADHRQTAEAIRTMIIRGAGTIGATAGYALAQACLEAPAQRPREYIRTAYDLILKTRPTAADLKHALDRVIAAIEPLLQSSPAAPPLARIRSAAMQEAQAIADDYVVATRKIAGFGERLIKPRRRHPQTRVLTHCNAGWLAIVDWGSALAPIYLAHRRGRKVFVWVDETRPRNQGANLTSWELLQEKIPHAIIADNAAGFYMRRGEVDLVITGADRIAANGDAANKIGTYEKAVLAKENGIPFYIAAPTATIDLTCPNGDAIPIEERSEDEVHYLTGSDPRGRRERIRITARGARARNPAFDVTPARYITAIITERGVVKPNRKSIARLLSPG